MNQIEALIYCLGYFDSEGVSHSISGADGELHWVVKTSAGGLRLCSSGPDKFHQCAEPYNTVNKPPELNF